MPEYTNPLHFKSTTRCALCRKLLPEPNYKDDFVPLESVAWEYNILGICDIADPNKHSKIVVARGDLTDAYTFNHLPVKFKNGRSLTINLCLEPSCKEERLAYLVHLDCWKLINVLNTNPSASSIYEFAHSTYPMFELNSNVETRDVKTDFDFKLNTWVSNTGLGELLKSLVSLPAEIRLIISAYCSSSFPLSLLTIVTASTTLVTAFKNGLGRRTTKVICPTVIDTLCTESISVFGHRFISCLRFNEPGGIFLERLRIKGIKFAIGCYGLQALSVLYTDNTTSPWLGDPTNGWIGIMYGSDIRRLRILQDDLKYLRVDFIDEETASATMPRVLWDQDFYFTATESHHMLETVNTHQIRNYHNWKLCKYLPFLDDGEYISGLTMYSSGHSITGMMTHGKRNRLVGNRQGCPIHFYFYPNERIKSIWLRIPVDHFNYECDPTILITTSFNRTCVFGPSLAPVTIRDLKYSWSCLHRDLRADVTGIFYDALAVRSEGVRSITNIGITENINAETTATTQHLPLIPILQHIPPTRGSTVTGGYLSIGNLCLVERLEVRKVGPRFTGMSIYHEGGGIEILGQWDPSQKSLISEVYNHKHGSLMSLAFGFSGETNASYVNDIYVGLDTDSFTKSRFSEKLKFFPISGPDQATIMWWSTRLFDHIGPWTGGYQKINVSTHNYNIVDLR